MAELPVEMLNMIHSEKTDHLLKKLKNELQVSARRVALELHFALLYRRQKQKLQLNKRKALLLV